jgi:putative ABC transport system permease protein
MSLTLPQARYGGMNSTLFYDQLAGQLRGAPGVASVAFTSLVPFGGSYDRVNITQIRGEPDRVGADAATADRYVVSPSYFSTMGVRLVGGRLPTDADRFDGPAVCVIDEVFAHRTFGDRNPIGQVVTIPPRREATIVGVVTHVKTYGLDVESPGQVYLSNTQFPWRFSYIVVRTTSEPLGVAPSIARAVRSIDPTQPVSNTATMDDMMSTLLRGRRFTLALFTAFAAVAITLATIGLYGVIAYGVSQRRREFGVRMALGARPREIARMVILDGGRIAAAGLVIGAAGALAMGRLIASLLFELSARDVTSFAAVAAGLVAVVLIACLVPARRATSVDAAEVLRGE